MNNSLQPPTNYPLPKRILDVIFVGVLTPVIIPLLLLLMVMIVVLSGTPVFYSSFRVTSPGTKKRIVKFRAMDSARVRAVMQSQKYQQQVSSGYLSLDVDSGVYTRAGRFLEKYKLVELPELLHVLRGDLSLVGNRPLPSDMQDALNNQFNDGSLRLYPRTGIFGVVQLIGRQNLTSYERIELELAYSKRQMLDYSLSLDICFIILCVCSVVGLAKAPGKEDIQKMIQNPWKHVKKLLTTQSK